MTNYEEYNLLVSGAAATGTIILAVIAIFGGWIRRLFIKPKISMAIDGCEPYVEEVTENSRNLSEDTKYKKIHLKIVNSGKQTALNSQVLIEKIFKKRDDNQTYFLEQSFIPCNLTWLDDSESKPITNSISHFIEILRIQKYQELSSNVENESPTGNNDLYQLRLSIESSSEKGTFLLLGKGTFLIPVIFYSDNISSPITIFVEIFWHSDSLDGMNKSNFYVKVVNKRDLSNEIIKEL